jgi:chromosomal replication initiator protein
MAGRTGRKRTQAATHNRRSSAVSARTSAEIGHEVAGDDGGLAVLESSLRTEVAARLGESKFGLWFGEGVHLGFNGDSSALEVQVPNTFFREWIEGHYAESLIDAGRTVTGRSLPVSFRVYDEAEPPLGDVVEPAAPERRSKPTVTIPLPGIPVSPAAPPAEKRPSPGKPRSQSRSRSAGNPATIGRVEPGTSPEVVSGRSPAVSAPAASPSRAARRLDDFIPGPGSRLAHAAAREMAVSAGSAFNPLVIHGAVGLGKTHLLDGVGHLLRQSHPGLNVLHITAEAFTNNFLDAMRTGTLSNFRARLRGVGALILDDVHFLATTRATQGEFLHTFNALASKGAPIILSADQHPRLLSRLSEELVTRFLGGMVVKLESPDLATRRSILQAKALARGVDVPAAVIDFIAEHLRSSVRELEGALHTVVAHALLVGKRLDLNLARSALRDTIRHTSQAVAIRDVERAVCQLFQLDPETLRSDSRARAQAYPRMLAMYLARKHAGAAYSEIGRYFGGRNHSTVISAEKKVVGWLRDEQRVSLLPGFESVADLLADLERSLGT